MTAFFRLLLVPFLLLAVLAAAPARADEAHDQELEPRHELGMVKQIAPGENPEERVVTVEITTGELAGRPVSIVQHGTGPEGLELEVEVGDRVVVAGLPVEEAGDLDWQIVDYQRSRPLWALAGITAIAMLAIGGLRGLKTLLTLGLTVGLIAGILVPMTLRGWSPLPLAVILAALVGLVTTLLTSGPGRKTWAAVAGSTAAIAVAAAMATVFVGWSRLTGMVSEESLAAHTATGALIDFQGLLAASMLVGALGVVLDLALSIASAVDELRATNPTLSRGLLFRSGWQVGRDLLSTTSNTLLLAYLGGFLPVMLALSAQPPAGVRVAHLEPLAGTATTLMIGLLGLLAAVPLTAAAAALLAPSDDTA